MKKLKLSSSVITFILLLSLIFSCRTIKDTDYLSQNDPINNDIKLEGIVNIDSLRKTIKDYGNIAIKGYYNTNLSLDTILEVQKITIDDFALNKTKYKTEIHSVKKTKYENDYDNKNDNIYHTKAIYKSGKKTLDIIKLFSKEVYGDNFNASDKYSGKIKLQLIYFDEKKKVIFLNAYLMFIPALFGVPVSLSKTRIKIKVSIIDNNNSIIKEYISTGHGKSYIALYWGYGNDVSRRSAMLAFKDAFQVIKQQISEDKEKIISILK